ncbi:MAG: methylenetetrahydrofolate reductase [Hyphomicrobiaceae bacterium]
MTAVPVSIEVTAKHALETENLGVLFPQGTRVYLADLGTHSVDDLVTAAARLRDAGYQPVPHIAARRMAGVDDVDTRLGRFMAEAGVAEFLMVAGSPESQVGPLPSSLAVLETGLLQKHSVKKIVVAGHPEGSPDFPDSELMPALKAKQAFGKENGVEVAVATQFSFDVPGIIRWETELVKNGIDMLVHIGVAGPAKLTTLIRYATLCGVGQSVDFLKKRGGALATMVTGFSPDEVVTPLEEHIQSGSGSLITQIHVFPFGGLKKSSEWLTERGSWFQSSSAAA